MKRIKKILSFSLCVSLLFVQLIIPTTAYADSSNANLSDIKLDEVSINGFASDILEYNIDVDSSTTSTTITVTIEEATSIISGDVGAQGLNVGLNTFIVIVTAEDTTTNKEYTINITRAEEIIVEDPTSTPVPSPSDEPTATPSPATSAEPIVTSTPTAESPTVTPSSTPEPTATTTIEPASTEAPVARGVITTTDGIVFDTDTGTITDYTGSATDLVIPSMIESVAVIAIGDASFFDKNTLESVSVPNSVISIGANAFSQCSNLTSVTISESVASIGDWAFVMCDSLLEINVSNLNTNYSSIDGILFNKDKTEMILYPAGKTETSYTIPVSVENLGIGVFYNCTNLTSITLHSDITSVGSSAFYGCSGLTSITLPNDITSIGGHTFYGCSSLSSVIIPNNVISIGEFAFLNCSDLTGITIPENVTSIVTTAFDGCHESLTIYGKTGSYAETYASSHSITFVDDSLSNDATLSNLTIDSTTITSFSSTTYSYNITFGNSTDEIVIGATTNNNNATLSGDTGAQSLSVGDNTFTVTCTAEDGTTTQDYVLNITRESSPVLVGIIFDSSTGTITDYTGAATSLVLPTIIEGVNVVEIGDNAFEGCVSLTDIEIRPNIIQIAPTAFANCSDELIIYGEINSCAEDFASALGITFIDRSIVVTGNGILFDVDNGTLVGYEGNESELIIPDSIEGVEVEIIGSSAFSGCISITNITLPTTLKSLESGAFSDCTNLESFIYPEGFETLSFGCFSRCTNLISISLPSSLITIDGLAFQDCLSLEEIILPDNFRTIGLYAFDNCTSLKKIIMPSNVSSVDDNAFNGCELIKIYGEIGSYAETYANSHSITFVDNSLSTDATLSSLTIDSTTITGFSSSTYSYDITVGNSTDSVVIGATANNGNATLSGDTGTQSLSVGANTFTVTCTAEDGGTQDYVINIIREDQGSDGNDDFNEAVIISLGNNNNLELEPDDTDYYKFVAPETATFEFYTTSNIDIWAEFYNESLDMIDSDSNSGINGNIKIIIDLIENNTYYLKLYASNIHEINSYEINILKRGFVTTEDGIEFDELSGTITGCNGTFPSISIPKSINGVDVVNIADEALSNFRLTSIIVDEDNDYFSSIDGVLYNNEISKLIQYPRSKTDATFEIPNSVSSIGYAALSGCGLLTNITIPNSVISIAERSFYGNVITSITIPNSIISIGDYAFGLCRALNNITFQSGLATIGNRMFSSCEELTEITIPNSVVIIGDGAFSYCYKLESILIPDSVTKIGKEAFQWCKVLNNVILPSNLEIINKGMFSGCEELSNISIPNGVTEIGDNAFSSCQNLLEIDLPAELLRIGNKAFYNCNFTNIDLPSKTNYIGQFVFSYCDKLSSITIPNSVENIDVSAFSFCLKINNVTIPDKVTELSNAVFAHCPSLSNINLPESLEIIGESAFNSCSSLESITLPTGLKIIKGLAFWQCVNLGNIYIPENVIEIQLNAFCDTDKLTDIIVDDNNINYKSIDGVLFNKNGSEIIRYPIGKTQSSYSIPGDVTTITKRAFHDSINLTTIIVPNGLINIDIEAFSDCKYLTDIVLPDSLINIKQWAFRSCDRLTSIIIPDSVTNIDIGAFYRCSTLSSVTFNGSDTVIGDDAFDQCSSSMIIYGTNGSTAETYANNNSITFIYSTLGNDATLSGLTIDGTAVNGFSSTIYGYYTAIDNAVESVDISAVATDSNATITGDIGTQNLSDQLNTFTITCTSENGVVSQDYVLNMAKNIDITISGNNAFDNIGFIPLDVAIDPSENIAYMTEKDGYNLYRIDLDTGDISYLQFQDNAQYLTVKNNKVYLTLSSVSSKGAVAVIDTDTFSIFKEFEVNLIPRDIVADSHGVVYVGNYNVLSYNTNTGELLSTLSSSYYDFCNNWDYNEVYSKIYSMDFNGSPEDIVSYVISNGQIVDNYDSPYHGVYDMTPNFKISPDGQYLFNGSGYIFTCAEDEEGDMIYDGDIDEFSSISFDLVNDTFYTSRDSILLKYNYTTRNVEEVFVAEDSFIEVFYSNNQLISLLKDSEDEYYFSYDPQESGYMSPLKGTYTSEANGLLDLGFIPLDIVIDQDGEFAYMTEEDGFMLYRVDLTTGAVKYMEFNYKVGSIVIKNGNLYVALSHIPMSYFSGSISVIDINSFTLAKTIFVEVNPHDIEVDNQGIVYIGNGTSQNAASYDSINNECLSTTRARYNSLWDYNASYNKLYSITTDVSPRDIDAYEITEGLITENYDSPYHGDYEMTPDIKISPDGQFIFNGSGNIFTCAPTQVGDMIYDGNIDGFTSICFDIENNAFYTSNNNILFSYNYSTREQERQLTTSEEFIQIFYEHDELIFLKKSSSGEFFLEARTTAIFEDTTLSDLTFDGNTIPDFNSTTYSYDVTVGNSTESVVIGATVNDGNATLSGDTGTQNLSVGNNTFTVTCTAENGVNTQDYVINISREAPPEKIAILFGMADYVGTENDLHGPVNDMIGMKAVLEQAGYTVYKYMDYSAAQLLSTVQEAASNMTSDSTLLFAYSGHGADGGYLVGADNGGISINDLESKLALHTGVKEVIIDACYSGDFIGKSMASKDFVKIDSQQDFNNHVISVFSNSGSKQESKSLAESGYYVMTACTGSQLSYEHLFDISYSTFAVNNLMTYQYEGEDYYWLGYFNYAFQGGIGLYNTPDFSVIRADSNSDGTLTWDELYRFSASFTNDEQQAQVYPLNSSHVIYSGSATPALQSSTYTIDQTNSIVSAVSDETTIADFKVSFSNADTQIKIYKIDETEVTSGYIGTGMKVKLVIDGSVKDELEVCILGDIDGNGLIDIIDYTYVKLEIFDVFNLNSIQFKAADIDNNGVVNILDYTYIKLDIFDVMSIN